MPKFDVMPSKFRMTVFSMVAVCGLVDLCILRLLPWLPTEFSKYVNGYPNLFALRCYVYGSNVSLVLQCIASVVLLVRGGQSAANLALSIVLVALSISLMLKTFMETVFAIQKERSDKVVTVLELDKHLLQSVTVQAASRESLIKMLDDIAALRLSNSEVVWKTNNPLRSSMDDTVISLQKVDCDPEESKQKVDEARDEAVAAERSLQRHLLYQYALRRPDIRSRENVYGVEERD